MGIPNPNPLLLFIVRDHGLESQLCNRGKLFKFFSLIFWHMPAQGKGKSAKEILKRIDYLGSLCVLLAVRFCIPFILFKFKLIVVQRLVQPSYF